jgi:voltage-gated potassium channel
VDRGVQDEAATQPSRGHARARIWRAALTCIFMIALYYLIPVEPGVGGSQLVVRTALTIVGGVLVTWLIIRQIRYHLSDPYRGSMIGLLTGIVGGVTFFALVDYITAISIQGEFVDLHTKTDGLYFALTTLTTVGFGDVHAQGQVARGLLVVQLAFNVVVITTAASVLARSIGARRREGRFTTSE